MKLLINQNNSLEIPLKIRLLHGKVKPSEIKNLNVEGAEALFVKI